MSKRIVIAAAGFSGAGKTTALRHLEDLGIGRFIYAGEYVHSEIEQQGLARTPENERLVRERLRHQFGRHVLAMRVVNELSEKQITGGILVDAVYLEEEEAYYRAKLGAGVKIMGIFAPFEVRSSRLADRQSRPLSPDELRLRDEFEKNNFGIDGVLANADWKVTNDGSLEHFKEKIQRLLD